MEDMALYVEKIDLQGMMQEYLKRYVTSATQSRNFAA